jgi:uncharacterized protein (TIGR00299 family) protein
MKVAYFDCQFGAAGDMLNACLLAAGLDEGKWLTELSGIALPSDSYRVQIQDVMRCGINCKSISVLDQTGVKLDTVYDHQVAECHAHDHGHPHSHAHTHSNEHRHSDEHPHSHEHTHTGLSQVLSIIERSTIAAPAKDMSARIFTRLANAEAKVHNVPPDAVHFHEVGAIDAIVDILGFSIGYHLLGIEKSFCSPVAIGSGKALCEHGIYPAPGPATAYLLEQAGAAVSPSKIEFECLTPTGAAILCEISSSWGVQPPFSKFLSQGFGAGTKDPSGWPNACRVFLGEQENSQWQSGSRFDGETVLVMEANLDDLTPQTLAFVMERLLEAGALDVSICPVVMKKGRPGHVLTVLCRPADRLSLEQLVLTQTTSLGVRFHEAHRSIARRHWQNVQLKAGGTVRIKLAEDAQGNIINVQPEYEDCAAYAAKHNVPLKDVINQALVTYLQGRQ